MKLIVATPYHVEISNTHTVCIYLGRSMNQKTAHLFVYFFAIFKTYRICYISVEHPSLFLLPYQHLCHRGFADGWILEIEHLSHIFHVAALSKSARRIKGCFSYSVDAQPNSRALLREMAWKERLIGEAEHLKTNQRLLLAQCRWSAQI